MSDADTDTATDQEWPRRCGTCGTELTSATVELDEDKAHRPELRPGEMVAVDYCPNRDCPDNKPG